MSEQTTTTEAISAFLDNEPFDAQTLVTALEDPRGRALLIDLVALRHLVEFDEAVVPAASVADARGRAWWRIGAAAAVVAALFGGYGLGRQLGAPDRSAAAPGVGVDSASKPPAPARVIELQWQETRGGQ